MDVEKPAPPPSRGITEEEAGKRIQALLAPKKDIPAPEVKKDEPEAPATVEAQADDEPPEGDPPAQEEKRKYKVPVDGDEVEVDEDELLRGYSRTANYTRKSQKLAEERKAFDAEAKAVREERQQYGKILANWKTQLAGLQPPDPNLAASDPVQYNAEVARYLAESQRLQAIESEEKRLKEAAEADAKREWQSRLESADKYVQARIPEWKDAKRAKKEQEEIADAAAELGYTTEDLAYLRADGRAILALRKAMLYDKMVKEAKKTVERAKDSPIRTARPGNMQERVIDQDLAASRERFGQKRDVHSLGQYLSKRLAQPKR